MVSPPQMPVPLKHTNNANILSAEFTIFVPNYPPMWYTIIIPQLSFFKNRSKNGMLSSTVLSYSPMKVKWSNLPRSPQIFLRLFTENTHILLTPCNHPKISQHTLYLMSHTKKTMCACKLYTKLQHSSVFFNSPEAETTIYSSNLFTHSLVSSHPSWISAHSGWWDHITKLSKFKMGTKQPFWNCLLPKVDQVIGCHSWTYLPIYSLVAIVIKRLMIRRSKCHQNNSPVVCDGYVKYEEAEVDRLVRVAILKTNNCGGGPCGIQ